MNFDNPANRKAVVEGVAEYLGERLVAILNDVTRTCLNCEHFKEGPPDRSGEHCGLNGMTPPPSIAARGCDNHMDKVPF